jgi:hypothetical protein
MSLAKRTAAVVCALAIAGGLVACGNDKKQGVEEPAREGLALDLGGVDYNVFITRELNLKVPPDQAYYDGPAPGKGQTLYGVFIQVCNNSSDGPERQTAEEFEIVDNQGNKFRPTELPADNEFAYHPGKLALSSARRPARCSCSSSRSRPPRTVRWSSRSRARTTRLRTGRTSSPSSSTCSCSPR